MATTRSKNAQMGSETPRDADPVRGIGCDDDGTLEVCCSSHNLLMCRYHYARFHFVETDPRYNGPTCWQATGRHNDGTEDVS